MSAPQVIYLDHHATAPLRPEVLAAMMPWLGPAANPSSAHAAGRAARRALEEARASVAAELGRPAAGIVFTSGASEANALAAGAVREGRRVRSALEHPSLVAAMEAVGPHEVLGCGPDGVSWLPEGPPAAFLALIAVQHETGVVQPVAEALATGASWVHVDAVQAVGRVPLALDGVASVTLSAHKLGGPVGVGVLSLAGGRSVPPLIRGAQERGMRGGTTPVALAVGMAEAVRLACRGWEAEAARQAALRDALREGLGVLGARAVGRSGSPSVVGVVFPGLLGEDVVIGLDLEGVAVSAGAACASGSQGPSPALAAMGDAEPRGLVRFSLGPATTLAEVEAALRATARVVERLRA